MRTVKKMLSFLSAFLMAMSMTAVFNGTALAVDCTATDASSFESCALSAGPGDTIIVSSSITSLTGTYSLGSVAIRLQAGVTLSGDVSDGATFNFTGMYPGTNTTQFAPIMMFATPGNPVTIERLIINDGSTLISGTGSTILATTAGTLHVSTTVKDCIITCGSGKTWGIESGALNNAMITGNEFHSCGSTASILGTDTSTLTFTGNKMEKSGPAAIDNTYLRPSGGTISGNEYDPSDAWPAFDFFNDGTTYSPTQADFNKVVSDNSFYPIVVRNWISWPNSSELYNDRDPGVLVETVNGLDAVPVHYALNLGLNAAIVKLTYGFVKTSAVGSMIGVDSDCHFDNVGGVNEALGMNRECVLRNTILLQNQFPIIDSASGYSSCNWFRGGDDSLPTHSPAYWPGTPVSSGPGLADPITQEETFILKCTPQQTSGSRVSVPTTGSFALVVLGLLLAGLAVVGLRNRYQ